MWVDEPIQVPAPVAPAPAQAVPVLAPPVPAPAPPAPVQPVAPAQAPAVAPTLVPEAAPAPQGRLRSMGEVLEMAMTLAPDLRAQVLRRYMEELLRDENQ